MYYTSSRDVITQSLGSSTMPSWVITDIIVNYSTPRNLRLTRVTRVTMTQVRTIFVAVSPDSKLNHLDKEIDRILKDRCSSYLRKVYLVCKITIRYTQDYIYGLWEVLWVTSGMGYKGINCTYEPKGPGTYKYNIVIGKSSKPWYHPEKCITTKVVRVP